VPIIRFDELDTFAFVDADSDEAKAFTTYLGYWGCLARCVTERYGTAFVEPLVADLRARKAFRRLSSSQFAGDTSALRSLLLNAWNSEIALYLVDLDDDRLIAQNQWNNVYAYYATGRAALAWLLVRDGNAPRTHRKLLDALAAQAPGSSLFPEPWSFGCALVKPLTYVGFTTPPPDVHNLERDAPCEGGVAKLLKTTRNKRLKELKQKRMIELKVDRAPRGLVAQLDDDTTTTTVFDFMWRSRTRANYGDPSMFYMGTLDQWRSREYVQTVRTSTSATMLLFESLVAEKARGTLIDAAVHFMSRDRSKITDEVLAPRLRALDLI
jgi:hypothetical protein